MTKLPFQVSGKRRSKFASAPITLLPVLLGLVRPDAGIPVWMNALNLIPAAILYGLVLALWRPAPSTES
jgi:hypothetical protein